MAKKAKWLEESTNAELIDIVIEGLGSNDSKVVNKAKKAAEELKLRTPDEDGLSVEEALTAAIAKINEAQEAYQEEMDAIDDEEELDDEDEDEEEEDEESEYADMTIKELRAECKAAGIPTRGLKKDDLIEALEELDEEDEEDDEDEEDYTDWSIKDLKTECRERGIKVSKTMKKADLVKALEADDEE